jgi:hypothetical protein
VDFKLTSDDFFKQKNENFLANVSKDLKFDAIFIDGLHISSQVERDIKNSLNQIKDNGFIILHDCNPPSEYHQREIYEFKNSSAGPFWNGTTWKAFYKYRHNKDLYSICFDTDWGVAVLSKQKIEGFNHIIDGMKNEFYEFDLLNKNRKVDLNLQIFELWKKELKK